MATDNDLPVMVLPMEDEQQVHDPVEEQDVKNLKDEFDAAWEFDAEARKQYALDRLYAAGKVDESWVVDSNLLGNYIDILVAFLYARDPDVSARPGETVGSAERDVVDFSHTLQVVVSKLWKRRSRLKKAIRKMTRSGLTIGAGWFKAVLLVETETDPQVQHAINDARDNLARLDAQIRALKEGGTPDDLAVQQQEIARQIENLEANLEVVVRKDLAIDYVKGENVLVSLDVETLDDYLEASWIANIIYKPKKDIAALFPRLTEDERKAATLYYQRKPLQQADAQALQAEHAEQFERVDSSGGKGVEFARIIEIWDRRDNHVKTLVDGVKRWAKEPFLPHYPTTRFYPFFYISFYPVDGFRHAQSLSWRLHKLQDEYASSRSNNRLMRERSIPGIIFNEEQIDPDNARKLKQSVHQEFTGLKTTNPNIPFRDLFAEKPVSRIDPLVFDTTPITRDMEKISGVQEALQASISRPKTATEAEIQQSGFAARTTSDRDVVEDMLNELAPYTAELTLQCLTREDVVKMAGKQALWPDPGEMDVQDLDLLVQIEIKGGTTGKPNTSAEREAWATALPLIRETMVAIQQAEATGNATMAQALTELLRETLRRLDDRIDIERFIPHLAEAAAMPGAPGATPPAATPFQGAQAGPAPGTAGPIPNIPPIARTLP